jgi:hypothetical protein
LSTRVTEQPDALARGDAEHLPLLPGAGAQVGRSGDVETEDGLAHGRVAPPFVLPVGHLEVVLQQLAIADVDRLGDHVGVGVLRDGGVKEPGVVLAVDVLLDGPAGAAHADRVEGRAVALDELLLGHEGRLAAELEVVVGAGPGAAGPQHGVALAHPDAHFFKEFAVRFEGRDSADVQHALVERVQAARADGTAFSYTGHRLQTGGQVALPWYQLSVRYDFDVHFRSYKNTQTLFLDESGMLSNRSDVEHNHLLQIMKPLPHNLLLTAQYQRVVNSSNIPVYDYTKNVFMLLMTWIY